jgi:hypothetical protein
MSLKENKEFPRTESRYLDASSAVCVKLGRQNAVPGGERRRVAQGDEEGRDVGSLAKREPNVRAIAQYITRIPISNFFKKFIQARQWTPYPHIGLRETRAVCAM